MTIIFHHKREVYLIIKESRLRPSRGSHMFLVEADDSRRFVAYRASQAEAHIAIAEDVARRIGLVAKPEAPCPKN